MTNEPTILHAGQTFLHAFNLHLPSQIAECFVADGQMLPSYCQPIRGRGAIEAFWQGIFDVEAVTMERQILEIETTNEWGYETGCYALRGKQGRILDQGKYLVIWRQIDGTWKRYREIWNSSPPDST